MKEIILINNWIDTAEKELDAINLITTLKSAGYDVCLSSHNTISPLIQKLVDIFVYEKNNYVFPEQDFNEIADDELAFYFHDSPVLFYKQCSRRTISFLQTTSLIFNALNVCKSAGYTHFFFLEGDHLINSKDINVLQQFKDKAADKGGCFILYNEGVFSEPFYYCEIDTYLQNVPNPRNPAEFIKACRVETGASYFFLGSFLYHYLHKHVNYIKEFDNTKLFPNSQINKYVKGKTYGYVINVVDNAEFNGDKYFIVDTIDKTGENLRIEILTDLDIYQKWTRLGFDYINLGKVRRVLVIVYNNESNIIEQKLFDTTLIDRTSYLEFKNK